MVMLERTYQILKGNMEDTGTASKTQKEKASSALLRHITWWWETHTFKRKTAPNNIQKWGPVFNSRLHHHQKRETKEYQGL